MLKKVRSVAPLLEIVVFGGFDKQFCTFLVAIMLQCLVDVLHGHVERLVSPVVDLRPDDFFSGGASTLRWQSSLPVEDF